MNPLIRKGIRERLRVKQLVASVLFGLIVTSTFYLTSYLNGAQDQRIYNYQTKQNITIEGSAINGARSAFGVLLGVQGFFLMFLGTGRVASVTAEDKESGLLDYQRMTPMNPISKISGYLLGLPAREYFMFLLTLPFLLHCVTVAEIPWINVGQLYLVFFSSVILYHLTAHVTGLVVSKPRAASWISRVAVMGLYIFLPALSQAGISFLSFLTILPTYFGKIAPHLKMVGMPDLDHTYSPRGQLNAMKNKLSEFWQDVPFFHLEISPALFTFIMQALILTALLITAYRKWRNQSLPSFSKRSGLIMFAILQFLLLGSLWPFFAEGKASGLLGQTLSAGSLDSGYRAASGLMLVQSVFIGLSMVAIFTFINICCPDRDLYMKGVQRAEKQQLKRLPLLSDERSGLWPVCLLVVMTSTVHAVLIHLLQASSVWNESSAIIATVGVPFLVLLGTALYMQASRELWFNLGFVGFLALLWITPGLASMVIVAGWGDEFQGAVYRLLALCPLSVTPFHLLELYAETMQIQGGEQSLFQQVKWFGVVVCLGMATLLQLRLRKQRRSQDGDQKQSIDSN